VDWSQIPQAVIPHNQKTALTLIANATTHVQRKQPKRQSSKKAEII
jgi:hypothetical protein